MLKTFALPAVLAGIIAAGVVAEFRPASPAGAGDASMESAAVAKVAARNSFTARAVSAARAFKESLSSSQRAALQYSFDSSEKRSGWSNLPTNLVPPNGVAIKDLRSGQRARLRTLLQTILSSQGYADEVAVRKADAYLKQEQQNGSTADQIFDYGAGLYYVAFFGTPSRSKKWTVQFGGHHYALHMTFSGASVSHTPYFIGVNPPTAFKVGAKTYQPLADEVDALFGAVRSLNASQRATARLSQSFDDVLVGPLKDGQFPAKRGITVSTLSTAQRKLVTRAIRSYVGDMPRTPAKRHIRTYKKQYSKTKLAWSGSTDPTTPGAYVRIHGPRVWIEIVVQEGTLVRTHHHSMERDIKRDYGPGT
jgi:hypothetical protein